MKEQFDCLRENTAEEKVKKGKFGRNFIFFNK